MEINLENLIYSMEQLRNTHMIRWWGSSCNFPAVLGTRSESIRWFSTVCDSLSAAYHHDASLSLFQAKRVRWTCKSLYLADCPDVGRTQFHKDPPKSPARKGVSPGEPLVKATKEVPLMTNTRVLGPDTAPNSILPRQIIISVDDSSNWAPALPHGRPKFHACESVVQLEKFC